MNLMKYRQCVCIFTIFSILLLTPSAASSPSIESITSIGLSATDAEWDDGAFEGDWMESQGTGQGSLEGILTLGRSDESGWFSGTILINRTQQIGQFNGRFFKSLVFGILTLDETSNPYVPFFGTLQLRNESMFSAIIHPLSMNTIEINCQYHYSFLPNPTGPYDIGIMDRHLIDTSREELYTNDESDYREMMLRIWYPIQSQSAEDPVEYMDFSTFQWLKDRSPIPLITINDDAYLSINPHGFSQGELSTEPSRFPILLFSPGYDGNVEIYTSFIEDVVSHGYVVFSINHPYISGLTSFPDGRKIRSTSIESFSFETVVGDALFVLDYIIDVDSTDPMLQNRLDLDRIGMYGHSFGGAATLEVMKQDPRVKAGLTLDGAIGADLLPETFEKPFMLMLAEKSFAENTSKQLFNRTDDDGYLLTIMGSTHYAFTDVGLLMKHFIPLIPPDLLMFGTIDAKRMVNITRTYIREFFDVYLQNEPIGDLLGLQSMFQEAVLVTK